jgi:hypothetical protein
VARQCEPIDEAHVDRIHHSQAIAVAGVEQAGFAIEAKIVHVGQVRQPAFALATDEDVDASIAAVGDQQVFNGG